MPLQVIPFNFPFVYDRCPCLPTIKFPNIVPLFFWNEPHKQTFLCHWSTQNKKTVSTMTATQIVHYDDDYADDDDDDVCRKWVDRIAPFAVTGSTIASAIADIRCPPVLRLPICCGVVFTKKSCTMVFASSYEAPCSISFAMVRGLFLHQPVLFNI